jgi:DNA-binding protein HU-beta
MTKQDLVEMVAARVKMPKMRVETVINAVLEGVRKGIRKDGKVQLVGFGTFFVRTRKARRCRHPLTGRTTKFAARKKVGFRPSSAFKGIV